MEFINFKCGKCKEYWNIIKGRMINDKRCMKCNSRICEKCYDDVEMCLKCEIDYLERKIMHLMESYDYHKLILNRLKDKYKDDSNEEYNSPPSEED